MFEVFFFFNSFCFSLIAFQWMIQRKGLDDEADVFFHLRKNKHCFCLITNNKHKLTTHIWYLYLNYKCTKYKLTNYIHYICYRHHATTLSRCLVSYIAGRFIQAFYIGSFFHSILLRRPEARKAQAFCMHDSYSISKTNPFCKFSNVILCI